MGNITIRTTEDEDQMIAKVQELVSENTASKTLKRAVSVYESNQREIKALREALEKAESQNRKYKTLINAFKSAQQALLNID